MTLVPQPFGFAPAPQPGWGRGLIFALLVHAGLFAALTWGVRWHRESPSVPVQAELWSVVPVNAAPPVELPSVVPPPPPAAKPKLPDPDIVTAQEKRRLQKQQALDLEKERQQKLQKQQQEKLQRSKAALEKQREAQDKQRRDELRKENLARMAELAGTAQRAAGPSAQYANRIRDRIKRNVVFTEEAKGNPAAEVQVRTSPDGTIIGRQLVKSSGIAAWDQAVLNAIDKTAALPRDEDGRVPPSLVIVFRPKDDED